MNTVHSFKNVANGNFSKEGSTRYLVWGHNDKPAVFYNRVGTSTPTVFTNYFYNAQSDRVKKVTRKGQKLEVTVYVDGGLFELTYTKPTGGAIDPDRHYNTIYLKDGNAAMVSGRIGTNTDDNTPALKYHLDDHLGSCTVILRPNGNLVNREEFYPFGETSFGAYAFKRYRYNGKEKDEESGLYNYGQRYYAPWTCRFVSVDPIAEDYPQLSSYNYAGNKPITSPDIEGLQSAVDDSSEPSGQNTSYSPQNTCTTCPTNAAEGQVHFSTDIKPFNGPNNQMLSGTDGKGLSVFMSDNLSSIAWVNFGEEAGWQAMAFKTEAGELFTWSSDNNWYVNEQGKEFNDHLSFDIVNMVGGSVGLATQAYIDQIEAGDALSSIKTALSEHGGSVGDFILDGFKQTLSDISSGGHSGSQALGSIYMGALSAGPSSGLGLRSLYNGTYRGTLKGSIGMKRAADSAKRVNYYTLVARDLGHSSKLSGDRIRAGIFVQANHNFNRMVNFQKPKLLYSNSPATIVGRQLQNDAISRGLGLSIFGGGLTLTNSGFYD